MFLFLDLAESSLENFFRADTKAKSISVICYILAKNPSHPGTGRGAESGRRVLAGFRMRGSVE